MLADKTLTIKGASDEELDALLLRIRKESELQDIIATLSRRATPNDKYQDLSYDTSVSTEVPIDNLYHFGVLGMHWGIRKDRRTLRKAAKAKKQQDKDDSWQA